MKDLIKLALATLLLFFSSQALSQADTKYFGYFASPPLAETSDHTNVVYIWASYSNRAQARSKIVSELNQARAMGLRAIVGVDSFLFRFSNGGAGIYTHEPNAHALWAGLMDELVALGHVVPGDRDAGTVLAFYPVDEPELHGLKDINTSNGRIAHTTLQYAVSVVRSHPSSAHLPLAVIASKKYGDVDRGLRLFDWLGLDHYDTSTQEYLSRFSTFQNRFGSSYRYLIVPQASQGGMMQPYGAYHLPLPIYDRFMADSRIIVLMPFLWSHPDTTGVRDIPELRERYWQIGRNISFGDAAPLRVDASCNLVLNRFVCSANASAGRPPYQISWRSSTGVVTHGSPVNIWVPCGTMQEVTLTLVDAGGYEVNQRMSLYCPPGGGGIFGEGVSRD